MGSLIDLPVARLRGGTAATIRVLRAFGVRYLIPEIAGAALASLRRST